MKILFLLTLASAKLWIKIPKYEVDNSVSDFLEAHQINDCFYIEEGNTLLLKCLVEDKLMDVTISIKKNYKKRNFAPPGKRIYSS